MKGESVGKQQDEFGFYFGVQILLDQQIIELIEEFHVKEDILIRSARRPAGSKILIETRTYEDGNSGFLGLADFWLHGLHHFLEDTGSDPKWLEGLAYQSLFKELSAGEFLRSFGEINERLTLPAPTVVELRIAYRVLDARVVSYCGETHDGYYWCGTFGPHYFE